ncbi:MAG TPA: serine hydrolase domain-containing protein [Actinophytocola sp.]|jgi:CubicO group peptidase (beta-lactamase class C family)|nr:serine hydrolase domain-containing protein [Actinophytocola sp.]
MRLLRLLPSLLVGFGVVLASGPPASAAPAPGCATATPAALADFFDRELPDRLRHDRVPGAVVSVVSGRDTVFAKGYGMADAEHGVAFSPSRSLVRIASITKLFTWTAVMQQVEAGRLDLDVDVNRYLKAFKIPATFPKPVTLRDLMDHTAGFEERIIGTAARTAADMPALEEFLADDMPARIRPPGEVAAYSNYGAALAGYIVGQVSGESYEDYVRRHLLDPLGMTHSTAAQPVPAGLARDLASSVDSDEREHIPFEFDTLPPDGSISATADDMAKFMIAHLHPHGSGILTDATAERMHTRSFAADPRLGGFAHGFMDRPMNGHRVLMHDGSWEGFESVLVMVPDCDLGLFVSANGTGGIESVTDLMPKFFDRFVPEQHAPAPTAAGSSSVTGPRAGFYLPARHNESTVEKLNTLLGPVRLTVGDDGVVHFKGKDWTAHGDGVYRLADGSDRLMFLDGADGRRYVATDGPAYQLMSPDETLPVNLVVLLVFAVPALTALAVPIAALVRGLRHRPVTTSGTWRLGRGLAAGAAGLGVAFLVGLTAVVLGESGEFLYAVPANFRLLLAVPIVILAAATGAIACTIRGWRGNAGLLARIHQVTLLAGIAALVWFLWQWNLIGWQF